MLLAGEPNEAARELWNTKTLRALQQPDGRRRAADLRALFVERHGPNGTQHWIYPDHDERVVRILRKIVRGLAFHHFGMVGISDDRVRAETLRYVIPEGTLDDLHHGHRLAEVFAYWYTDLRKDPTTHFDTVWLIRIFERRWFIVWVLEA